MFFLLGSTGTSLGQKTVLFSRVGDNAPLYAGLPASKNFSVERAFMKTGHTFQLAFLREPTNTKRKYLFSFEYPDVRSQCAFLDISSPFSRCETDLALHSSSSSSPGVARLQSQIATCLRNVSSRTNSPAPGPISPQVRSAAEAVALQVLRDALIPTNATEAQTPLRGVLQPPPSTSRNENGNVKQKSHARQASSSVVYSRQAGRGEIDLDEKIEREKAKAAAAAAANSSTSGKGRPRTGGGDGGGKSPSGIGGGARVDEAEALREAEELAETPFLKAQTGREIAMLCQQNRYAISLSLFLSCKLSRLTRPNLSCRSSSLAQSHPPYARLPPIRHRRSDPCCLVSARRLPKPLKQRSSRRTRHHRASFVSTSQRSSIQQQSHLAQLSHALQTVSPLSSRFVPLSVPTMKPDAPFTLIPTLSLSYFQKAFRFSRNEPHLLSRFLCSSCSFLSILCRISRLLFLLCSWILCYLDVRSRLNEGQVMQWKGSFVCV
jgi:hypothetical protein